MPVEREGEETQTLIVRGSTEDASKDSSLITSCLHSSQTLQHQTLVSQFRRIARPAQFLITYRNRDRVEPDKNVGREDFIESHSSKSIPEVSQWLRIFDLLPMKSLEYFDSRQGTPVDSVNMPDRNGTHESTNSVAK